MTNLVHLSKILSHALRHTPEEYGLTLDVEGWAPLEDVLIGVQKAAPNKFADISLKDIRAAIKSGSKTRHEISGGLIRAIYGHSVDGKIEKTPASNPPTGLFHGTSRKAAEIILREGLKPMDRQYVHLSATPELAKLVGSRKDRTPVIFTVDTQTAQKDGVIFYEEKEDIWLSTNIPALHLKVSE